MTPVHEREETPLVAFLRVGEQAPARGAIVGYVDGEIVVAVARCRAACFAVGQVVHIRAGDAAPDDLPEGLARAVRRHEEEHSRSYVLHPLDGDRRSLGLQAWIGHVFNRRSAFRVRPRPCEHIEVALTTRDGREGFDGLLVDLSESGMGLGVDTVVERQLATERTVHLRFDLPGGAVAVDVDALIRARVLKTAGIRYGLEFEHRGGLARGPSEDEIFRYVRERELELLHGRNDE